MTETPTIPKNLCYFSYILGKHDLQLLKLFILCISLQLWSAMASVVATVIVIMTILLVSSNHSYLVSADDATSKQNYVTPTSEIPCINLTGQAPCLTLDDYANQPDLYFVNNTIFYFLHGTHRLNATLILIGLHNITLQGLPGNDMVLIMLDTLVNITFDTCYNVEISSFSFKLTGNFSYSIAFQQSNFIKLLNVTILGSKMRGQSSITSQNSSLNIADSKFISIKGYIGAALQISDSSIVTFIGNNSFKHNLAKFGGAIYSANSVLILNGTNVFVNNKGTSYGGGIEAVLSDVTFAGTVVFIGNLAIMGAAIMSIDSKVTVKGNMSFESNAVHWGGGIALIGTSKLVLIPPTYIAFIHNYARIAGGALFVKNDNCPAQSFVPPECFLSTSMFASRENISLYFVNNTAGKTGSVLYGGLLNMCRLCYINSKNRDKCDACNDYSDDAFVMFMDLSRIYESENSNISTISSTAQKLRYCRGDKTVDKSIHLYVHVYPGEQFTIPLVALGQTNSPVPTTLFSINMYGDNYRLSPPTQGMNSSCTNVTFRLYSANRVNPDNFTALFFLYPTSPCKSYVEEQPLFTVIHSCPLGFVLSDQEKCTCDEKLLKLTPNCFIDNLSIERQRNNFWISKENDYTIIIYKFRCPLDYCETEAMNVTLSNPNVQCDFNRNDTLCGRCVKNFSLALGSLHCLSCSNKYLALILPFTLAGVILVTVILLLRLTVAVGTLNGLLFYANIIQANYQAFFPRATINFFTIFISWLNLDLGIETCFYDGMDIYAYSWLQFLFPFYIWFLIGCIILVSRHSRSFANTLGTNPVAVLATLLLMSFSKILKAIITPLSWTYLTYYNSTNKSHRIIWLYDGSIGFFTDPKHAVLASFAILILFLFVLPYLFLLLCGQWLVGFSDWRILSWLNKLKPLMDAYYAPYKKHTRYWTGLLLWSRMGLFLTIAINVLGSDRVNILAISSATAALLAIKGRVYEDWWKDILESSFHFNLIIFSTATFYLKEEGKGRQSQLILSSISVGTAFITFIGILLFHISYFITSTNFWKLHMLPYTQKRRLTFTRNAQENGAEVEENANIQALPTYAAIAGNLREPLITN